jgi:arylsulfatase A-like enzyme
MRQRIAAGIAATALVALAWFLIDLRHRMIHAVTTYDSPPREPAPLPAGMGPGLAQAPKVRVVLIDGLSAQVAEKLPAVSAVCKRGIRLTVDVGFPTVSLPVEAALWTGLTQQQTGIVFRSDRPIVPPLADSIPAHVPTSVAIAESHGYIVRSLGFHQVEPVAGETAETDADPDGWAKQWEDRAREAVAGDARLVFVHVLRVDVAGHAFGGDSPEYHAKAEDADAILGKLVDAARDARWFVL